MSSAMVPWVVHNHARKTHLQRIPHRQEELEIDIEILVSIGEIFDAIFNTVVLHARVSAINPDFAGCHCVPCERPLICWYRDTWFYAYFKFGVGFRESMLLHPRVIKHVSYGGWGCCIVEIRINAETRQSRPTTRIDAKAEGNFHLFNLVVVIESDQVAIIGNLRESEEFGIQNLTCHKALNRQNNASVLNELVVSIFGRGRDGP
jgi:hypothetical protein